MARVGKVQNAHFDPQKKVDDPFERAPALVVVRARKRANERRKLLKNVRPVVFPPSKRARTNAASVLQN